MLNVLIERKIVKKIKEHLEKKEISLLLGPRQAGKTTVLKLIENELKKTGKKTFFFNLDIFSDKEIVENQTQFIEFLKKNSQKDKIYVFIDEIQRIKNSGLFLKGIYDSDLNCKLIVSGSSSLEIKSKIFEPLTGRKKTFFLFPLSFEEFLNFKEKNIDQFKPIKKIYLEKLKKYLDEYTKFGGYPRVVLSENENEKIEILEEIYSSYIEKDIKGFFEVKNESSFSKLVLLLSSSLANIINKDFLASSIGSNRTTVDNYLYYLEKSFVIKIITPFFSNPKKEIIKMPKVYFYDFGLRNLLIRNFSSFFIRQDKGEIFENFVLNQLEENLDYILKVNFWRSRLSAEVDFVIQKGKNIFPIEVKAAELKKSVYSRSFRSFISRYHPNLGFLININYENKESINNTQIYTLPFYSLNEVFENIK